MSKIPVFLFLFLIVHKTISAEDIKTIDLLVIDKFVWDGYNLGNTLLNIIAKNFWIAVTIDTCDIGNSMSRPNEEYLILRNGILDGTTLDNGRIFAYITEPKHLYFYSSSVVLELRTPDVLKKSCKVIFEKADIEESTLPPVTTTEISPTFGPNISKYATILVDGKSLDEFNKNKNLLLHLKDSLVEMANKYTKDENFCLVNKDGIKRSDIIISVLEQCPAKWKNSEDCIRLVYSLPIAIDESCSVWKGYQLTKAHLDIMWTRWANKYLKNGFKVYEETDVDNVLVWWITGVILATLVFVAAIVALNLIWKKRRVLKKARAHQNEDFMPEIRQVSDISLSPPYFQSIPPMFDKTYRSNAQYAEEAQGADNEGFQYDEFLNCDEDATTM